MEVLRKFLLDVRQQLEAAGCDGAHLESEMIFSHVLKVSRAQLIAKRSESISEEACIRIQELVKRRIHREPLAYILGQTDFYGRSFHCHPGVLIPRVDTEVTLEAALKSLRELKASQENVQAFKVLELGVGSGCIIVSLLAELCLQSGFENLWGYGSDLSQAALQLCAKNADIHGVGQKLELFEGSWFEALPAKLKGDLDLIIINPPYISRAEEAALQPEIRDFEPAEALYIPQEMSGFEALYRHLAEAAKHWLKPCAKLVFEVGDGQAKIVSSALEVLGYQDIQTYSDGSEHIRALSMRNEE